MSSANLTSMLTRSLTVRSFIINENKNRPRTVPLVLLCLCAHSLFLFRFYTLLSLGYFGVE